MSHGKNRPKLQSQIWLKHDQLEKHHEYQLRSKQHDQKQVLAHGHTKQEMDYILR